MPNRVIKEVEEKYNLSYFILSREIFDSAIWQDNPHILKLFLFLVGNARYKKEPKKYPAGLKVKRGELITSLNNLVEANEYTEGGLVKRWSRSKVSRMLKTLEEQGYVKLIADTYGTHIKVCNYELYQDPKRYRANSSETAPNSSATGVKQDCNGSENNSNKDKKGNKEKKNMYGEFKKVRLTQDQYNRIAGKFGKEKTAALIKILDEYRAEKGKSSPVGGRDDLTLQRWVLDEYNKTTGDTKQETAESIADGLEG